MNNTYNLASSQPDIEEIFNSFKPDSLSVCEYITEAGVFVAQKSGKYGLINSFGRIIVPTYATRELLKRSMGQIQEPINPVLTSNQGIVYSRCIDVSLQEVDYTQDMCVDILGENCIVTDGERFGIADSNMNILCECIYDEIAVDNAYLDILVPYREGELWGLISVDGAVILPARYKSIGTVTHYGYTDVKKGRKSLSLLVHFKSDRLSATEYEGKLRFSSGISTVTKKKFMGYVDVDGNIIYPIELDYAFTFFNGMGKVVQDGLIGFVNIDGELSVPAVFDGARDFYDDRCAVCMAGNWGYIDRRCKTIVPFIYKAAFDFVDGFARVQTHDDRTLIIDTAGNAVLEDTDTEKILGNPVGGMVPYSDGELCGFKYVGKATWLSNISPKYDMVRSFSKYHAVVTRDGLVGLIDNKGRVRLDTIFDNISEFDDRGLALGTLAGGSTCFLMYTPENPESILMLAYDMVDKISDNMVVVAKIAGDIRLYGVVSIYGTPLVPIVYSEIVHIYGNYFVLKSENAEKFVEISNIGEANYSGTYDYIDTTIENDRILVMKNGFYGYIDTTGDRVVDCVYEEAFAFSGGLALVKLEGRFGYINCDGEIVVDTVYDNASSDFFRCGYAVVIRDGLYGIIDRLNTEIVPCEYTSVDVISKDMVLLMDRAGVWHKVNFTQKSGVDFIDRRLGIYSDGDSVYIHDDEIFSLGAVKKIQNYQLLQIISERGTNTRVQLV